MDYEPILYYEFHAINEDGAMGIYVTWDDGKYSQPVGEISDCFAGSKETLATIVVEALNNDSAIRQP